MAASARSSASGAGQDERERKERRRQARADQFDADRNGELDATEREALAGQLRRCALGEEPLVPPTTDEPAPDAGASP